MVVDIAVVYIAGSRPRSTLTSAHHRVLTALAPTFCADERAGEFYHAFEPAFVSQRAVSVCQRGLMPFAMLQCPNWLGEEILDVVRQLLCALFCANA
jgi:hypothetical protein